MAESESPYFDSPYLGAVLLAVITAYLPHMFQLPAGVTLLCLASWSYLLLGIHKGWRRPPKVTRNLLALGAAGLLFLGYGASLNLKTGVSMLAVLLALKPLEITTRRDAVTTLLLTSFLLIFSLFFSQSLITALFAMGALITLGAALLRTTHEKTHTAESLRISLRLLLQGAPLALALFLVFPRFPGGLLGFSTQGALSGVSDVLAPGDISNLVLNRELAFRVNFESATPPRSMLYWRGIVLWDFDGRSWQAPQQLPKAYASITGSSPITYRVMQEPNGQRWLFTLDMPISGLGWAVLQVDHTLRSRFDVTRTRSFTMTSFLHHKSDGLSHFGYLRGLRLPEDAAPNARALAQTWLREEQSPQGVIDRCLQYFHNQGFLYSLTPPAIDADQDPVDTFLFETKKGFCGHYASAMTFLLRAAGIPARVVVGYLGGEENTVGGYLMVRQSDAHAWVEAWIARQGWVRLDPTAMVAPERLDQGLLAALANSGGAPDGALQELPPWLRAISMRLDSLNYQWERTVLGYSYWDQRGVINRILRALGMGIGNLRLERILIGVTLVLSVLALSFLVLVLVRRGLSLQFLARKANNEKSVLLWERFCAKMARNGLPRPHWQGPMEYAATLVQRLENERPDLCEPVTHIAEMYAKVRYAPPEVVDDQDIAELETLVRKIPRHIRRPHAND